MGIAETKIPGGDSDLVRGDDMRDRGQRSTSTETGAEARGEGRGVELELGAEQMSESRWSSRCLWGRNGDARRYAKPLMRCSSS